MDHTTHTAVDMEVTALAVLLLELAASEPVVSDPAAPELVFPKPSRVREPALADQGKKLFFCFVLIDLGKRKSHRKLQKHVPFLCEGRCIAGPLQLQP